MPANEGKQETQRWPSFGSPPSSLIWVHPLNPTKVAPLFVLSLKWYLIHLPIDIICVRLVNIVTALLSHSSMNANSPASWIAHLVSIILPPFYHFKGSYNYMYILHGLYLFCSCNTSTGQQISFPFCVLVEMYDTERSLTICLRSPGIRSYSLTGICRPFTYCNIKYRWKWIVCFSKHTSMMCTCSSLLCINSSSSLWTKMKLWRSVMRKECLVWGD